MRRKKRSILLAIAVSMSMMASNMIITTAAPVEPIRVTLDGYELSFSEAPPQIINDRTMVPLRAIVEAMGATVEWEPVKREVTVSLYDKFVRMYIGNEVMKYGSFSTVNGTRAENNVASYILDSPPIIIEDRTMVPARAISEGLGGSADWIAAERTVVLVSPPFPVPVVDTTFDDNPWFINISAARAQEMYDSNMQFVLAYYNSEGSSSKSYIPMIKSAAKEAGVLVYAVDASKDYFSTQTLTFIWRYFDKNNFEYPILFRVFGRNDVFCVIKPTVKDNVITFFKGFVNTITNNPYYWNSGTPSATPTPTPRPSATPVPNINQRFTSIDRTTAETMLNNGQKFIFVSYHSGDYDSNQYLDSIKQAAITAGVTIYGADSIGFSDTTKWWANPTGTYTLYPTIYFINNKTIITTEVQPKDVNRLVSLFSSF